MRPRNLLSAQPVLAAARPGLRRAAAGRGRVTEEPALPTGGIGRGPGSRSTTVMRRLFRDEILRRARSDDGRRPRGPPDGPASSTGRRRGAGRLPSAPAARERAATGRPLPAPRVLRAARRPSRLPRPARRVPASRPSQLGPHDRPRRGIDPGRPRPAGHPARCRSATAATAAGRQHRRLPRRRRRGRAGDAGHPRRARRAMRRRRHDGAHEPRTTTSTSRSGSRRPRHHLPSTVTRHSSPIAAAPRPVHDRDVDMGQLDDPHRRCTGVCQYVDEVWVQPPRRGRRSGAPSTCRSTSCRRRCSTRPGRR